MSDLIQHPAPGMHLLRYCGDVIEIRLRGNSALTGKAFLNTNIGNAAIRRSEVILRTEQRINPSGQDWNMLPMERLDPFTFAVTVSLPEEGHFEFKTCLMPDEDSKPIWVPGDNVHVNVSPAAYCASDSVYCAFVRQYGPNRSNPVSELPDGVSHDDLTKLDDLGFSVIPKSGTFRDLIAQLDHIIGRLKCRIVHLLPVNPTPTVFARMGRFGSPYAALDFTGIDPSLAEFDKKATPLDQFLELADAVHRYDAKLFIDIAINHTGWASVLQQTHPEWFIREQNGDFHSPGAWGVVWGDLVELDHTKLELWEVLAQGFLTWCERGVNGFRCDAGYMIPEPAWEYIIAKVRDEYPETIFLLEGLGGDPAITNRLLDAGNMDWAYSELFQNYSREQVEGYLKYAWRVSAADGVMIHYSETHDNLRLAATSLRYARMRTALAALASNSGAFGFANGVEWFATEKIDVHEACALNWNAAENQVDDIARLNSLLAIHPAFHANALLEFIDSGSPNAVVMARADAAERHPVLAMVNLDCARSTTVTWNASYANPDFPELTDLLSGRKFQVLQRPHHLRSVTLQPGQTVCLSGEPEFFASVRDAAAENKLDLRHVNHQEARAMAVRLLAKLRRSPLLVRDDPRSLAETLVRDPEGFLHTIEGNGTPYVVWEYPSDLRRNVMIPPGHAVLAFARCHFQLTISDGKRVLVSLSALRADDGRFFVLIPPLDTPKRHRTLSLCIRIYCSRDAESALSPLLQLAKDVPTASVSFTRNELYNRPHVFLQGNGRGGVIHMQVEPNKLSSRYDAMLLANLNGEYPSNRHIMLRRVRIWVVYHSRLQELTQEALASFHLSENGGGVWSYSVPVGNGRTVSVLVKIEIVRDRNAILMTVHRSKEHGEPHGLPDNDPVRVILRPDIEDRDFHFETKAANGPEQYWPAMVRESAKYFDFSPAPDRILRVAVSSGTFHRSEEWEYMIFQPNEAARGLDPHTDLYSPGYFRFSLGGDETAYLCGQISTDGTFEKLIPTALAQNAFTQAENDIRDVMRNALAAFVVKRNELKTVIAGYPWFLDWGRDTLIAVRGLLPDPGFRPDVRDILIQFAKFEENGTIPNMIHGSNADNRDTSDAPLWLFSAVQDFCLAENSFELLKTPVRGKESLLDVLESLARGILKGTPNGIGFDPESALVFSPSHFTWMDTNYPAGTPREGYPVEIQALWFRALLFLAEHVAKEAARKQWRVLAEQVRQSILQFFVLPEKGYLSDCLHAAKGTPAANAVPDDHLRPNQLLAITLGAVSDPALCRSILRATQKLLIPGAIRSLADQQVEYKLPICGAHGQCLNAPSNPYWGNYEGDEDTRRKPAYHNGTAWTWQFPLYPEAYYKTYGPAGRVTAVALLSSMTELLHSGCVGQLPEILDGNVPHTPRGCDAQAWGMSEFFRVWLLLHE